MAGITGTSSLGDIVNAVRAKAIFTMQDSGVFPGVVDKVNVPDGNASYTEPKIGTLSAYALTEGVDMQQAQQLTDSLITVTPSEVGAQVIYTKMAQQTRSENVSSLISKAITDAIKKKQDVDGTTMLDGFSTSLGSGSSTTLTRGYIGAAIARIRGNSTEISTDPLVCVIHPYSMNDLIDQISDGTVHTSGVVFSGLAGFPEEVIRNYGVSKVHGVPIMTDSNITVGSNAAKGGVFTKRALVYAELWGLEIEPEPNASLRAIELNGTICYAYGERTDTWGVELNVGATAPTS